MSAPRSSGRVTDFGAGEGLITFGNVGGVSFLGASTWTFEVWVYLDALLDQMELVSRQGEFSLQTRDRTLYAARTGQFVALTTAPVLDRHQWFHLAVTCDGGAMAAYVNGVPSGTVTLTDPGIANQNHPLTLGAGFFGWSSAFRIWNVAVGPRQIYANQWQRYPTGTAGLLGQIDLAQWPPKDTSGNALPVTPASTGVGPVTLTPAVRLGGTSSFCDPYGDAAVNPGGDGRDFSIMATVRQESGGAPQAVFANGDVAGAGSWFGLDAQGHVALRVGAGATVASTAAVSTGAWHNLACTWSAAAGAATLYVDGSVAGTGTTVPAVARRATGAPLIGATADAGSQVLPDQNFCGAIQSVSVWSRALPAEAVDAYLTTDPLLDPTCIADWDLVPPIPSNSVTLNPVGIVGDATVAQLGAGTVTATSFEESPPQPEVEGIVLPNVGPEDFGADVREAWVKSFRAYMTDELGIDAQDQDWLAARMHDNVADVERRLADGTLRVESHVTLERVDDRTVRYVHHSAAGSTVVWEGELDACTAWALKFIIDIASAVWAAFGWAIDTKAIIGPLTTYLEETVANNQILQSIKAVFASAPGVEPSRVFTALKVMWDNGLLMPVWKVLYQVIQASLTIWAELSLMFRLLNLFGPYAPLQIAIFISDLAGALVKVVADWNDPANCWKSATPPVIATA